MEPKEKAIQLVDKYRSFEKDGQRLIPLEYAIKCALIAVDEILKVCEFHKLSAEKDWWQEVKQEIEKLKTNKI